jgi:hypothetical protein
MRGRRFFLSMYAHETGLQQLLSLHHVFFDMPAPVMRHAEQPLTSMHRLACNLLTRRLAHSYSF